MNEFAESNVDIVEGLQKSSAAMAAMGSSFDETLSLFTAGQEVIQDASLMGNALRSISMRVRGYDEETEQLSDELTDITGKVIDLTKVASNNYKGVSLFTDETQTEYKSIYTYLTEIASIYDELGAKERQDLLEKLFGKNRAQAGAAILTNIDSAKRAMEVVEQSAGSASRELEVYKQSVEYSTSVFNATLEEIAQSTISRDFLKTMIEGGTRLLETIQEASPLINDILSLIGSLTTGVTGLVKQIGLLPTLFSVASFRNIGKLKHARLHTATIKICV